MKSATMSLSDKELQERKEIAKRKYNGAVWNYFKQVVRIPRPYTTADFERSYFIPDL